MPKPEALADFSELSPDRVLHWVEQALGRPASNLCRPLGSYINRVYDVQMDDGSWVVPKFYRPGRWSRDALQDEQDFLRELSEAEIPVVAPLVGVDGELLHEQHGLTFAIFPKKGGRALEEPTPEQWKELGRLLARLHTVGEQHAPHDRVRLHPEISSSQHLDFILEGEFPNPRVRDDYAEVADDILERIAPLFDDLATTRLHGDCHRANILGRPGEPFFLIDFDDMSVGPPVQDLWMMLPGLLKNSRVEMDLLLEGYETFRTFDYSTLRLIEPLRAMRIIHYTAWCARQKRDGGFARVAPDWGSTAFWRQETADLQRQRQEIEDALAGSP
jgi:Ser/Thr protein kinase RdoA (MazF antagonist)